VGVGFSAAPQVASTASSSRREHEKGTWPLGHTSLDAPAAGELSLLEQLVEQLPAAQATALRLRVLEGLSLRAAAAQLQIGPMAVSHREVRLATPRAQKKALAALRQQLVGASALWLHEPPGAAARSGRVKRPAHRSDRLLDRVRRCL
jgi:DNA-directed RNA polymerase specialized sigma24 family protein